MPGLGLIFWGKIEMKLEGLGNRSSKANGIARLHVVVCVYLTRC